MAALLEPPAAGEELSVKHLGTVVVVLLLVGACGGGQAPPASVVASPQSSPAPVRTEDPDVRVPGAPDPAARAALDEECRAYMVGPEGFDRVFAFGNGVDRGEAATVAASAVIEAEDWRLGQGTLVYTDGRRFRAVCGMRLLNPGVSLGGAEPSLLYAAAAQGESFYAEIPVVGGAPIYSYGSLALGGPIVVWGMVDTPTKAIDLRWADMNGKPFTYRLSLTGQIFVGRVGTGTGPGLAFLHRDAAGTIFACTDETRRIDCPDMTGEGE